MVEFAIVLPLFLLITFGTIFWGLTLTTLDSMHDAARHGARELSVSALTESGAQASSTARLTVWTGLFTFTVTARDTGTTGNNDVEVEISATNGILTSLNGTFLGMNVPGSLNAKVVMRKEASYAATPGS